MPTVAAFLASLLAMLLTPFAFGYFMRFTGHGVVGGIAFLTVWVYYVAVYIPSSIMARAASRKIDAGAANG